MPNYVRTGPFTNGSAPGISASFLNNLENALEQPTGGTETGSYFLAGWSSANGDVISLWMPTLSRTSTPVSVSVDTSIQALANMTGPTTANLNANGFQVYGTANNGAQVNCGVGGNWTVRY